MCRHLAHLGSPVTLQDLVKSPPYSLETQAWRPRMQTHGTVNADGFGVGWYLEGRQAPVRYRRSQPIWTDASFDSLAPTVSSGCVMAAVRSATPAFGHDECCVAPFLHGRWLFSHNGVLADPARVRRWAAGLVADVPEAVAPVDSALLFGLAVHHLESGVSLAGSLAKVVTTVAALGGGRLNMLLTDGEQIAATAHGERLFVRTGEGGDHTVASEPHDDSKQWTEVPQGTLLLVDPCGLTPTPLDTTGATKAVDR
jgi:glutamine amidotransferase